MADYDYLPVSNGSGDAALMHINATRLTGATTISVDSVTNVPTKFIGTYGTLLPSGLIDPTTKCDFKGHVSGASLIIDAFETGSTDTGNVSGQVVIIKPNTGWANRVASFIKNATNFGTPEAVTFGAVTSGANTVTSLTSSGGITANGVLALGSKATATVQTMASGATLTPNADTTNVAECTALAVNTTIAAPSGTPANFQAMTLRIKDNGTTHTLTWNAAWVAVGVTLPASTVAGKALWVSAIYSSSGARWEVLSIGRE